VAAAEVLVFVPVSVGLVLLHRGSIKSTEEVARVVAVGRRLTLTIMVAGAVVLALLGNRLIPFVFGSAFERGATTMRLLLPGVCALGMWRVIVQGLAGAGHPDAKSVSAGLAAVLTVVLDLALTPRWGINGAAIASTIAYTGAFVVAARYARRLLRVGPVDLVLPRRSDVSAVMGEIRAQLAARRGT
jgi:O-antigen/teichoic acid export membrane protein